MRVQPQGPARVQLGTEAPLQQGDGAPQCLQVLEPVHGVAVRCIDDGGAVQLAFRSVTAVAAAEVDFPRTNRAHGTTT